MVKEELLEIEIVKFHLKRSSDWSEKLGQTGEQIRIGIEFNQSKYEREKLMNNHYLIRPNKARTNFLCLPR